MLKRQSITFRGLLHLLLAALGLVVFLGGSNTLLVREQYAEIENDKLSAIMDDALRTLGINLSYEFDKAVKETARKILENEDVLSVHINNTLYGREFKFPEGKKIDSSKTFSQSRIIVDPGTGREIGQLTVAYSRDRYVGMMKNYYRRLVLVLLAYFFVIALLSRSMVKIFQPLQTLVEQMKSFKPEEKNDFFPEPEGEDEIAKIARAGNEMIASINVYAEQLKQANEQLQKSRDELELRVEERTAELSKLNQDVNEARIKAEKASQAKTEFLANMSHEIRTPINGIVGMTSFILNSPLMEKQREYANIIRINAESLMILVNDILDLSRIEANKLEIETVDFNLDDLLNDLAMMMEVKAEEKGLELICGSEPDVPDCLQGDSGRLRQILINLAGNAIKFTSKGEVVIVVVLEEETETEVRLVFSVRDTGMGIPEEKTEKIFETFTQVDTSTTRNFGGTGLGLSISKQLIDLMKGEIDVVSEEGKGTKFWFKVSFKKQVGQIGRAGKVPSEMQGMPIMVVVKNKTSADFLTNYLEYWGLCPTSTNSALTALDLLRKACRNGETYQLVLIDVKISDLSTQEFAKAIREDEDLADIPLVKIEPLSQKGDAHPEDSHYTASLLKPVQPRRLYDSLCEIFLKSNIGQGDLKDTNLSLEKNGSLQNYRVLLAEDNSTNQLVVITILERLGLQVDAVDNGSEAVEAFKDNFYHIIIMDIQMPGMDGFEATTRIRELENDGHIPIIALTARAMEEDRRKCLAVGMDDYLTKPVDPDDLTNILGDWLFLEEIVTAPEPTSSSEGDQSPTFDRRDLLDRLMGERQMMKNVIIEFLKDMEVQLPALREMIIAGEKTLARRQAHKIKEAAAIVSGKAFFKTATTIVEAENKEDSDLELLLAELEEQYVLLKKEIEKEIN